MAMKYKIMKSDCISIKRSNNSNFNKKGRKKCIILIDRMYYNANDGYNEIATI